MEPGSGRLGVSETDGPNAELLRGRRPMLLGAPRAGAGGATALRPGSLRPRLVVAVGGKRSAAERDASGRRAGHNGHARPLRRLLRPGLENDPLGASMQLSQGYQKECARIQDFDVDGNYGNPFVLGKSDQQSYKQLGNAVNVNVIKLIQEQIDTYLTNAR